MLYLNQQVEHCFTPFKSAIKGISLPTKFTFPFYYQPHPLCVLAAEELQQYLTTQTEWQHNFGFSDDKNAHLAHYAGKMFGVLLVQNQHGELGYLAGFSGKLAEQNHLANFVPPVFDLLSDHDFFRQQQQAINVINDQLALLSNNTQIEQLQHLIKQQTLNQDDELQQQRNLMIARRKIRKEKRLLAQQGLTEVQYFELRAELSKESVAEKNQLKYLKQHWQDKINLSEKKLSGLLTEILQLKNQRKLMSSALQQTIFQQYAFLNSSGVEKNLADIFASAPNKTPPAGAGECAAPKLLQYAFKWQLKPLALAEFWWGVSPKSEIRRHGNFYPSCQNKCQPILAHMLDGMLVDDNPLLINPAADKKLDIIYQDQDVVVVNKPAELLSVPGKNIHDSVFNRIKLAFPQATGPLIVHRLDMSTSGLMVLALNKAVNKALQKQFIKRTVKKRYVALLDGILSEDEGEINLPLRVDLNDRPRQIVCHQHGKPAQTYWQVLTRCNNTTKVYFYPHTGRTHQLRVHAAHVLGLNTPIVGDDLYGKVNQRLCLHAEQLIFTHPVTKQVMSFQVDADF